MRTQQIQSQYNGTIMVLSRQYVTACDRRTDGRRVKNVNVQPIYSKHEWSVSSWQFSAFIPHFVRCDLLQGQNYYAVSQKEWSYMRFYRAMLAQSAVMRQ